MRSLVAVLALLAASAAPAFAATTVFATGVHAQSGNVANLTNAIGPANGAFARIGNASQAGHAVFSFADLLSGAGLQLTVAAGGGPTPVVYVSIGEIIAGVAVYSAETSFSGAAGVSTFDFSSRCALLSSAGCSLVRVRTTGGGGFRLDGISGVGAAPEPSAWALMLLGFGGGAWRLKAARRGKDLLTVTQ